MRALMLWAQNLTNQEEARVGTHIHRTNPEVPDPASEFIPPGHDLCNSGYQATCRLNMQKAILRV